MLIYESCKLTITLGIGLDLSIFKERSLSTWWNIYKTQFSSITFGHKHSGRRKCKWPTPRQKIGEFYTSSNIQRAKKEKIYGTTWLDYVIDRVVNAKSSCKKNKLLQFIIVFHLLK